MHPNINRIVGLTINPKTIMADTGLPGNPMAGLPSTMAIMVGLPGLMDSQCRITPGFSRLLKTSAVISRLLTELPA